MPTRIFISYRRAETAHHSARLRDRLTRSFGRRNVFMDVDNLIAGQRFDQALEAALNQTDVFIAVIGPDWLSHLRARQAAGGEDYVVAEVSAALRRGITIIPVLFDGAAPLDQSDLPEPIRGLALHHAFPISHERFPRDVEDLAAAVRASRPATSKKWMPAAGLAVLLTLGFGVALYLDAPRSLLGSTVATGPSAALDQPGTRTIAANTPPASSLRQELQTSASGTETPTSGPANAPAAPLPAKQANAGRTIPIEPQSTPPASFGPNEYINAFAVSPATDLAAVHTDEKGLELWDTRRGRKIKTLADDNRKFTKLYWAADGASLYALTRYTSQGHFLYQFHIASGDEMELFKADREVDFVAIGPAGPVAAVYRGEEYPSYIANGKIDKTITDRPAIWDPFVIDEFGYFKKRPADGLRPRSSLAPSPDEVAQLRSRRDTQSQIGCASGGSHGYDATRQHLVMVGRQGCFLIWDLKNRAPHRLVTNTRINDESVVMFSHDAQLFAVGDQQGVLHIWDSTNWTPVRRIRAHKGWILGLAFTADDRHLVTSGDKGYVKIWDLLTGAAVVEHLYEKGRRIPFVGIEESGRWALYPTYMVNVLEMPTGASPR